MELNRRSKKDHLAPEEKNILEMQILQNYFWSCNRLWRLYDPMKKETILAERNGFMAGGQNSWGWDSWPLPCQYNIILDIL